MAELEAGRWYWVRRSTGDIRPYRLHRLVHRNGVVLAEFYVGSMLQAWPCSLVVGPAEMPDSAANDRTDTG